MSSLTKGKKMVNGVPMATVYQGMSIHRLATLIDLYEKAWDECDADDDLNIEDRFQFLCRRAASKAGWHATQRGIQAKINKRKGK